VQHRLEVHVSCERVLRAHHLPNGVHAELGGAHVDGEDAAQGGDDWADGGAA